VFLRNRRARKLGRPDVYVQRDKDKYLEDELTKDTLTHGYVARHVSPLPDAFLIDWE
jgi:hypothetical protein